MNTVQKQTEALRVLIVEDHEIVAEAFKDLLINRAKASVINHVQTREEALNILRENVKIDLVLMDLFLGKKEDHEEPEGLKACRDIISEINKIPSKKVKIIMLTGTIEGRWIWKAFNLGVEGYVPKNESYQELLQAIDYINKGGTYYRNEVDKALNTFIQERIRIIEDPIKLTKAEKEILILLSEGKKGVEIAEERGVLIGTVDTQKNHLFKKLGVNNTAEAITKGFNMGILLLDKQNKPKRF